MLFQPLEVSQSKLWKPKMYFDDIFIVNNHHCRRKSIIGDSNRNVYERCQVSIMFSRVSVCPESLTGVNGKGDKMKLAVTLSDIMDFSGSEHCLKHLELLNTHISKILSCTLPASYQTVRRLSGQIASEYNGALSGHKLDISLRRWWKPTAELERKWIYV